MIKNTSVTYHIALLKVYMQKSSCIFPIQQLNSAKTLFFYTLDSLEALYSIRPARCGAVNLHIAVITLVVQWAQ